MGKPERPPPPFCISALTWSLCRRTLVFLGSCLSTADAQELGPSASSWCWAQDAAQGLPGRRGWARRWASVGRGVPQAVSLPLPSQHLLLPDVPRPWRVTLGRPPKRACGKEAFIQLDPATGVFLWEQGFACKRSLFETICSAANDPSPWGQQTLPLHGQSLRSPQERTEPGPHPDGRPLPAPTIMQ